MNVLMSLRQSTPQQNCQLSDSKQQLDDFWGEFTFQNVLIDTFGEMGVFSQEIARREREEADRAKQL